MPLSFLFVFICSLLFMICTMYFVLLKNLQHLHGYTNYWICLTINGILSQLWHDHFAERFISKVWLVLDHISVMENLCPQTPPLNFYNSPPPPPPPPLFFFSPPPPPPPFHPPQLFLGGAKENGGGEVGGGGGGGKKKKGGGGGVGGGWIVEI